MPDMTAAAAPATTRWRTKANGAWLSPANWTAGLPQPGTAALFEGGRSERIALGPVPGGGASAAADSLLVSGDSLTLAAGALALASATVAARIDHGGALFLQPKATVTGAGAVQVGGGSAGRLVLHGTLVDSSATIGTGGSVVVNGPAAHWSNVAGYQNLQIAGATEATLTVSGGGTVDSGLGGLDNFVRLDIGGLAGNGKVVVTGAGSTLTQALIALGNGSVGTLEIRNGGTVIDSNAIVGEYVGSSGGDGHVLVTGAGSEWRSLGGLQLGKLVPVKSSITIRDHGTVSFGDGGLALNGGLTLDPTATLRGDTIVSGGGAILAVRGPDGPGGTVTIGSAMHLFYNAFHPTGTMTTYLSSTGGTTLALAGVIQGGQDTVAIGAGHVALINPGNTYGRTLLYGGVLEIAATGAAGASAIQFAGTTARLLLDAGATLPDTLSDFAAHNLIDLAGIGAGRHASLHWQAGSGGGTLAVGDGTHTLDLRFAGSYGMSSFRVAGDGHGGTMVSFADPA